MLSSLVFVASLLPLAAATTCTDPNVLTADSRCTKFNGDCYPVTVRDGTKFKWDIPESWKTMSGEEWFAMGVGAHASAGTFWSTTYWYNINDYAMDPDSPRPEVGDMLCNGGRHDASLPNGGLPDVRGWFYYCTCEPPVTTTTGDPVTYHNGTATQFSLEDNAPRAVLKQGRLTVFYRVANPLDATHHTGADWITSVGVEVEGAHAKYINISVVGNPDSLLAPDLTRKPPLPGAPLTTMSISVGGKLLLAGDHIVESMLIKATVEPSLKRIGQGYKERVDIITDSFHMCVHSAKAKKFAAKELQVKALHLDVDFVKFEKTAVRGVLPELWGLVPISENTLKLIKPQ